MQNYSRPCFLEITLISAQNLRAASSLFGRRLRPFVAVTTTTSYGDRRLVVYKTKVDDKGGVNPTWGDRFQLTLDQAFFYIRNSGIHLQLYTKHLIMGHSQVGWCLIPAADIVDGLIPVGSTRFLSYRLRDRDGLRGHGVLNVAVKLDLDHSTLQVPQRPLPSPEGNMGDMVIGIPMKMLPEGNDFSQR